jgi:hypothetical protein
MTPIAPVTIGAVFEQARPAPGFRPIRYRVLRKAEREGWWWCEASVTGERRIPERALQNPDVYRSVS